MVEGLFQPTHLILILAIVVMVFGPGKLASLGSDLGKGMRELQRALNTNDEAAGPGQTHRTGEAPQNPPPPSA